ncbi:MAG: hypothetical protein AB1668_02115 [Nanoarchaeota archaeon]
MSLFPKQIPRKISIENISGYVFCPAIGLLPCADWHDKRRLIALAQIFFKAVTEKHIITGVGFPQTKAFETKMKEREAYEILAEHILLNKGIFRFDEHEVFAKKIGNKILYVTKEEVDKITGKK